MLISKTVRITRIISGTWKHFVFNIIICVATYLVYHFLFHDRIEVPMLLPSILGTALSFFIGFKNNQAYDRWWEARKIWGELVNDSRTWTRNILSYVNPNESINGNELNKIKRQAVHNHIAFVYALKKGLRSSADMEYRNYLTSKDVEAVELESNVPNAILNLQTNLLESLYKNGLVDGFKFMQLNQTLTKFCDEMGKSERISNTVFPTSYNYYTKLFIWIFIVCATLVAASSIGHWSIVLGILIGYVFLTTYKIGYSLLNPFEDITSGIPLNQISRTIEINLLQALGEKDIPEPVQPVDNEYIM